MLDFSVQMRTEPPLSAIVLAGGKSSRMGQDKALVLIDGIPLLQRVCDVALQCTSLVYVITPRIEQYRKVVSDRCHLIPEQIQDETKPHGPLVGFAQGLAHIRTNWVLLLACDMPNLSATILQRWSEELDTIGDEIALLPKTEKGWEPLCGFYRTSCLPNLRTAIDRGERSFQRWLSQERVKEIPASHSVDEECIQNKMLFNCNTPADLTALDE